MEHNITIDEVEKTAKTEDLTGLVGIDTVTGKFDINLVPENLRESVERMAQAMASDDSILKRDKIKGCQRKKKPRAKKPKSFGKNKKKKKK
jgi:hypothetical protein